MEFSSCNDFSQFFHVGWLDIDNVETLVLNVEIPEIYSQVITADESLPITIHGDAVDMVRVCVGICSAGYGGNDSVMVGEAG